jgi:hypothetical protein
MLQLQEHQARIKAANPGIRDSGRCNISSIRILERYKLTTVAIAGDKIA